MKKWWSALLLLGAVLALSFYFYQVSHEVKIVSLEGIVPEEAMYYIYSYNLNKKIADFTSSNFFRKISESSVYRKFVKPELEKFAKKVPFLTDIIEKDTSLAVFSLGDTKEHSVSNSFGNFLLLARVDAKKHVRIKKAIADFYLLLTAKGKSAYEKHNGIQITTCMLPSLGMTMHYALVSDVIIFGNSLAIVRKSIDLAKSRGLEGSLRSNPDFQRVSAKAKKDALVWGYSNTKRYYQEMLHAYTYNSLRSREQKDQKPLESFTNMKPMIDMMNTLIGQSFYLDYDGLKAGIIVKSYTLFNNASGNNTLLSLLLQDKAIDEGAFKMVPKNSVAYYGMNQDISKLWRFLKEFYTSIGEMIRAQMKSDPRYSGQKEMIESVSIEGALTMLESFLGVNIEKDILSVLGDNFGAALAGFEDVVIPMSTASGDVAQETSFIFPQVYAFCELKDSSKMQSVMARIMQSFIKKANPFFAQMQNQQKQPRAQAALQAKDVQGQASPQEQKEYLHLREKEYGGATIYSVAIDDFPVESLKVNYSIVGKYIVVSLSMPLTEKIIDVHNNKSGSFDSNYYFEAAQDYFTRGYSNIIFFDFKKMFDTLKATKSFSAFTKNLPADKEGVFPREDFDSLMGIGENVKAFTATNRLFDSETIESSSYLEIEGL